VKVDREIDELTMALKNLEHPGCCRGFRVVPWKFAGETLPPIEAAEEEESAKRRNGGKS
jgi:hypothetical protein